MVQSFDKLKTRKYTLHVSGTHCASCKILLEDIIAEQDFVKSVQVNLKQETIDIETSTEKSGEEIISILNKKVKGNGYTLSLEKNIHPAFDTPQEGNQKNNVIWTAIPIGLVFLILFFLLQKSGLLNFGIGS